MGRCMPRGSARIAKSLHHSCILGLREVLEELFPDGLVSLGDIDGLKEKVIAISNNDSLPKENTFTSLKMISETIKLYNQLVNKDL